MTLSKNNLFKVSKDSIALYMYTYNTTMCIFHFLVVLVYIQRQFVHSQVAVFGVDHTIQLCIPKCSLMFKPAVTL